MASIERRLARRDLPRSLASSEPLLADFMGPLTTFARMSRLMDELVGEDPSLLAPPTDIGETDEAYLLTVEVPGVKREHISIETRDHTLTIRGEKKSQREERGERAYRVERQFGVFQRTIALPDDADPEQVSASFQDGVLRITVAKRPETKPKTIEIQG